MKKNVLKTIVILFSLLLFYHAGGQNLASFSQTENKTANWSVSWESSKVFIENKGQFKLTKDIPVSQAVLFAVDEGATKIFFTKKGLVYHFLEKKKKNNSEEEREREAKKTDKDYLEKETSEKAMSYKTDWVSMEWEGANPDPEILAENQASEYFSYSFLDKGEQKNVNYIHGFKKLIYKNLYPSIDVEYIFHPTEGIKYSFLLHPGADASQIRMKYSDKIKLTKNGDIQISTLFGFILEHAPKTFYAGNKSQVLQSKYIKKEKTISLYTEEYDHSQTVIIDPWVQTPTLANSNCVWECEKDGAGNVYIIGGDAPMKLLKYNATGILQWTFTTAYDTGSNDWLGTFATDLAGNSYVTCGSTASLTKVTTAGAQVYSVTGGSTDEYWNIAFNCDQTKLVLGGTRLTGLPSITGSGVIFDINTSNGSVNSVKTVGSTISGGFGINDPDEVRSVTSSHNARYYYLTLDSIGAIDQNFSACPTATSLFKTNHSYAFGYKCENYRPKNGNSGIMAIRANKNFVYTQNGINIHKRSLTSGAILASAAIPGGLSTSSLGLNQVGNSGIDIDSCGNVYVGSGNAVVKYDANLNQLASTTVPFAVFDVAVSYGGNVIVSGSTGTSSSTSRTGYVQSVNMAACNPMTLQCCDATICPAGPFCNTAPSITLTPVTTGGTWSGSGVNAAGIFNPATAGTGTHTVIYTLPCGSDSIKIIVNACASLSVCQSNGNITASGGTPGYTWQTSTTYTNCSACPGGSCIPPICNGVVTSSLTTIGSNTNSIAAPSAYPLIITDAVGNTYTVTSLASVPTCTTSCASPTLTLVSSASVSCHGGSTGSASVTASPAGTYTWQPGNLNGAFQNNLSAGVYTVSASSGSTCTATLSITILQPATALSASITTFSPATCGQSNGSASVSVSGGTSPYTYTWSPAGGNTANAGNLSGGTYSVTASDANSCLTTQTVTITSSNSPTLSVNSATLCAGNSATLTVNGASTYSWSPATGLSSTTGSSVIANPGVSTIYTVTGSAGTCSSLANSTVSINPAPTLSVTGTALVCIGQNITLNAISSASSYTWSGPGGFNSNNQNPVITNAGTINSGTYTVSASANNCSVSSTFQVLVTNSTSVSINPAGPFCSNGVPVNLTASVAGGNWIGNGISNGINGTFDPSVSGSGSFTITYTLSGSCGSKDSVVITVNPAPTASTSANTPVCAGQSLNLTGNTLAGALYNWHGPNGFTSTLQNPVINNASLTNAGSYSLSVTSGNCSTSSTVNVTVVSNPTITVSSATVCAGITSTLTATGANTYTWLPGTGLSSTTGSVVTASANSSQIYTVSGSLGACNAIAGTGSLTILSLPIIQITNQTLCSSTTLTISVNGASTYSWMPGTGLSNTIGSVVTATPGIATTYTVLGTDVNGCVGSNTLTIQNSPSITSTINTNSVTCYGLSNGSVTLTASGGTGTLNYAWSPGGVTSNTLTNIPAGNYSCTITDSKGCTGTASVTISQAPKLTVSVQSGLICAGQSFTLNAQASGGTAPYNYNWNQGLSTSNPFIVSPLTSTDYTLVVTDANGCQPVIDSTVIVGVRPPLHVQVGDATICAGNVATLQATATGGDGNYSYVWTPGNYQGASIGVSPTSTDIYTVTVTDGCTGSPASDTALVTVVPSPLIPLPNPASGCIRLCVSFTNPAGLSNWQWNFGDSTVSNALNPIHCYTQAGNFSISLSYTSSTGCISKVSSGNIIHVYPLPEAAFSASPNPTDILNPTATFYNQSLLANSWQWNFGDHANSTLENPTHTYTETGVYPVMLIALTQQGCSDTAWGQITINDVYTFYAPNSFTPDENNLNPVFLPIGEGWDNTRFTLWIFDRWGLQIFKTQNASLGWDGSINGKGNTAQEDVYVWKVQLSDIFGKQHQYTGTVSLIK